MLVERITPLILTFNEAPNLDRTLQKLLWAKQVIIIDSFSTDATIEIAAAYPQVKLFKRNFDTHATQWNYGLEQIESEWVLSLDADYVLSDKLVTELISLPEDISIDGYFIRFKYCVFGKPLRGTILPPRQALFRKIEPLLLMMDIPSLYESMDSLVHYFIQSITMIENR